MSANHNTVNFEDIMACPLAKRTVAHEVVMAQLGQIQSLEHSYLTDKDGTRIVPKNGTSVKRLYFRSKHKETFFVKVISSNVRVGKDLNAFAEQMNGACYCYSSESGMVAVFCFEGSKEDRKQLKSIQDSLDVELKVLSNILVSDKNIVISGRPEVLTMYEVANQIGYEGWLTPKSFADMGEHAMPLGSDIIPRTLWVMSESIWQGRNNNLDYLVSSNIGFIGAVLAQDFRVAVYPHSTTYSSPNLWVLNVGHPSSGKTPAMSASYKSASSCMCPRDSKQERKAAMADQAQERRMKSYLNKTLSDDGEGEQYTSIDDVEKECEKRLKKVIPMARTDRGIYMTSDTTTAGLYKVMKLGRPIANLVDEGGAFFKNLDGKKHESTNLRSVLLNSESGTGHLNVTRATADDKTITNAVVSVIAGIQPDVFGPIISKVQAGSGNDGLLNRFQLMVLPVTPCHKRPIKKGGFSSLKPITAKQFFDVLSKWKPKRDKNANGEHLQVHFSKKAQTDYRKWLRDINVERSKYNPKHLMNSQLGKYEMLACKLGLIYQVILNYDMDECTFAPVKDISAEAFGYVKNTINYLMSHAKTIFGTDGIGLAQQEQAKCLLEKLQKKAKNNVSMTISEMVQCNWKNFSGRGDDAREAITDSLHYLEKMGIVKPVSKNNTQVWYLNPKAFWW
jgi:hypothetical protein